MRSSVSKQLVGVEVHLDFGIQSDDLQGGVIYKESLSFFEIVLISIGAISVIGEPFQRNIIQVADPETKSLLHFHPHLLPIRHNLNPTMLIGA